MLHDEFLCERGKKRSQTFAKVLTNSYYGKGGDKECRDVEKRKKRWWVEKEKWERREGKSEKERERRREWWWC